MSKYVKVSATSVCFSGATDTPGLWKQSVEAYISAELEKALPHGPDLFVFPEMCGLAPGMAMERYLSFIRQQGRAIEDYVSRKAQELGIWIAYSAVRCTAAGGIRNGCMLFDRSGRMAAVYDKNYLTQGELELGMEPGEGPVVHDCELGRIGFAICFDLNYLELAQQYRRLGVELILFPSLFQGGILRQIWAFEAGCYLAGASGGCGAWVVDPAGSIQASSTGYFPRMTAELNLDYALVHLDFNMDKLGQIQEKYGTGVAIRDPGGLGGVLLLSQSPAVTAGQLMAEYAMETRQGYLDAMAKENHEK